PSWTRWPASNAPWSRCARAATARARRGRRLTPAPARARRQGARRRPLGAAELTRRRDAAARARRGGQIEPWLSWIGAYHALMRATLHVKARLAARPRPAPSRGRQLGDEDARALAGEASR